MSVMQENHIMYWNEVTAKILECKPELSTSSRIVVLNKLQPWNFSASLTYSLENFRHML